MKNLLTLGLICSVSFLGAQSFEWNDKPVTEPGHAKEVTTVNDHESAFNERQTGLAGVYATEDDGSSTAYGETYRGIEMTGSHSVLPLGTLLRVTNPANGRTVIVRVTDRGRECEGCLITLSRAAASELGVKAGNSVDLERSGFSNWNPLAPNAADRTLTESNSPVIINKGVSSASGTVAPRPKPSTDALTDSAPRPTVFTREVTTDALVHSEGVAAPRPTVSGLQQARGAVAAIAEPKGALANPAATTSADGNYSVQLAAYNNKDYAVRRVSELRDKGLSDVFYRTVTKSDGEVINRVYVGNYANVNEAQAAVKVIEGKFELLGIVAKM